MTRKRLLTEVLALGVLALGLLLTGSWGAVLAHGGDEEGLHVIEIHMGEMFFQVHKVDGEEVDAAKNAPIEIEAGEELVLVFENVGTVEHEVHFGRNAFQENGVFVGYEESLFDGFLGLELQPGERAELHILIPEEKRGEWEIGCFIPGHYAAGMKAPFIVK